MQADVLPRLGFGVNITTDFARFLLEADQLAEQSDLAQALDVLQKILGLSLWPEEQALVKARQAKLLAAQAETVKFETVQADLEAQAASLDDDDDAFEIVERDSSVPPSEEARAESLVNDGDLPAAIDVYAQICEAEPDNSLAAERLQELRSQWQASQQAAPVAEMPVGTPPLTVATTAEQAEVSEGFDVQFTDLSEAPQAAQTQAQNDLSDVSADSGVLDSPTPQEAAQVVQQAASQVQAQLDASLADWRKDLPQDPVAMLQTLLDRVQRNRRPHP